MLRKIAFLAVTTLTAVAIATATTRGETKLAQEVGESLMRQKLVHAQQLLSALAIGDFEDMKAQAKELQRISLEARWSQPQSPAYGEYGDDFRSSLERLAASADKQNIDGAALNYVQVVLTCVQCHKVVREGQQTAKATDLNSLLQLPAASAGK
jgi:hypothetical protein